MEGVLWCIKTYMAATSKNGWQYLFVLHAEPVTQIHGFYLHGYFLR